MLEQQFELARLQVARERMASSQVRVMNSPHSTPLAFPRRPALEQAGESSGVPCFLLRPHAGVLPAFSTLTGGAEVRLAATDRAVAVVDGMVMHLSPP